MKAIAPEILVANTLPAKNISEKKQICRVHKPKKIIFFMLLSNVSYLAMFNYYSVPSIDDSIHQDVLKDFLVENKKEGSADLINNLNNDWERWGCSFKTNVYMPFDLMNQINLTRYLPLISSNFTDSTGMVGKGSSGITYLVFDQEAQSLEVAKFVRDDLDHEKKIKADAHLFHEVKNSKDWQLFSPSLNVRYENKVVFKNFVYGKSLRDWIESGELFNDEHDVDQKVSKLLDVYQKMFDKHCMVQDLQTENLIFSEIDKQWVIIDGGQALNYGSKLATISKFRSMAIAKLSYHIRIQNKADRGAFLRKLNKLINLISTI